MRKSTIFVSTVLTTFALVMLYGIVSAYRGISNVTEASASAIDAATPEPTIEATLVPTILTPEQAAQMAVQVVGNSNLLSAESSSINGVDAYKITFTNNDVVYVGLDGKILGVQVAPVVVNVSAPVPAKHTDEDKSNSTSAGEESHDDHEDHDD